MRMLASSCAMGACLFSAKLTRSRFSIATSHLITLSIIQAFLGGVSWKIGGVANLQQLI